MKCSKCSYYSFPLRRCKEGKINPMNVSIKNGADTMKIMGYQYFCAVDAECSIRRQKMMKG